MSIRQRRQWTAEKKLQIIEEARHSDSISVSEVCRRHQISPGQFYGWEKRARKGALTELACGNSQRKTSAEEARLQREIAELRAAIADVTRENLRLKKGRWP